MDKQIRLYQIDGDALTVSSVFNEEIGQFIPDYPDFENCPRFTPAGRKWVNVTSTGCPYADAQYGDCGSCRFFKCEKPGDLIGICYNDILTKNDNRKDA
ncbi:MAG: hypothetical protein J6I80_04055 [Clostridia bacterium]|nr:hypothetical protein [Clostridia bacterium]